MMGPRQVEQGNLFYEFSLDAHVPADHLLRSIGRFVDLGSLRRDMAPFYASTGRPSVDPELMIRMLLIGYCFGIRSERRLTDAGGVFLERARTLLAAHDQALAPERAEPSRIAIGVSDHALGTSLEATPQRSFRRSN